MPHATELLLAKNFFKKFTNYEPRKYFYKVMIPLEVKDEVVRRSEKVPADPCLDKMSLMLSCFKEHDFDESKCVKRVLEFQNCVKAAKEKAEALQKQLQSDFADNSDPTKKKRLPSRLVNKMLHRYPQPKKARD
ncbi:hypothetical protein CHS0354_039227 [Potamilus streckersoni]|uniref:CHCH domain-containing protein n=1 Tax=Potamilus streckersoni TaxID=2493646 RepID=A0AAE0TDY2_9BIVA|nr:hypothetical protein CHS0354_039227 [Potamilus streckersoni]